MKYLHKIIINFPTDRCKKYNYNYGNTKNIILSISKKGVSIVTMLSKQMTKEEMLAGDSYLFSDALKKMLLIYLIKYSKSLTIKTLQVQIGDDLHDIEDIPKIYSLINGNLNTEMHIAWRDKKAIQDVLWFTKSTSKQRMASLYALLLAKSKKHESERFIYFWMAFNGMYGYFANLIKKEKGITLKRECMQLRYFSLLNCLGENLIEEKDKIKIAQKAISIIANYTPKEVSQCIMNSKSELYKKIEKLLSEIGDNKILDITPYGYLLIQLTYYYRCNIIHANKPMVLFSCGNEKETRCLQVLNKLLEEFLDENLYKWFDKAYRDNHLKVKAKEMKKL